jgi:hypothetical protein
MLPAAVAVFEALMEAKAPSLPAVPLIFLRKFRWRALQNRSGP